VAIKTDGTVKCWVANSNGQLGNGTTNNSRTPVSVSGISTATQISAGQDYTCALLSGGAVKCWGGNWNGQLGGGWPAYRSTPVSVIGIP